MRNAIREFLRELWTEVEHAGVVRLALALIFLWMGGWLIQQDLMAGGSVALGFAFFLLSNAIKGRNPTQPDVPEGLPSQAGDKNDTYEQDS